MNLIYGRKILISILCIVVFYVSLAIYSDLDKMKENYAEMNFLYLPPIIGIYVFVMFMNSLRQKFFLNHLGINLTIPQNFLLFVAGLSMIISPLGSGQVIKSYFIKEKHGRTISETIPLVIAERFNDLLAVCVLILVTLFFFHSLESVILVTFFLVFILIFLLILKNSRFMKSFSSLMSKVPFLSRFIKINEFTEPLKNLFKIRVIGKAIIFSLLQMSLEGLVIYLGFLTFNVNFGYLESIQIYYTSILAGAISFIPGGVGITEGNFIGLLLQKHLELGLVTALIIFIRLTTIWFSTASGFISSYFIMKKK